jgi:type II secretory pathway component PulJ
MTARRRFTPSAQREKEMNAAKVDNSARLQRVLACLERHPEGVSSMKLITEALVVAPGTVVSELRHQGYLINCQRRGSVWTYTLTA